MVGNTWKITSINWNLYNTHTHTYTACTIIQITPRLTCCVGTNSIRWPLCSDSSGSGSSGGGNGSSMKCGEQSSVYMYIYIYQ